MDPIELLLWQLGGLALGVIIVVATRELGRPLPIYSPPIVNVTPPTMPELREEWRP